MKAKLAWTWWMLVLVPLTALGQLLPTRSIGVFGYQTLEPLGFNSSYSGIVDEWGSLPLPVMNLALNNCGINERIWRPTRSVLDGHYLLTGQVERGVYLCSVFFDGIHVSTEKIIKL